MRRISRITVAGAATASLALALSACGGTSTSSSSDSSGSKEDKGLAIAYDVRGRGDQSFNDAAYAAAVKGAAEKFPDTTFGIVDDATVEADNVADLVFSEEEASYLAGVAAAETTKTDVVGFIGGVDIPLIHKFRAGFEQGVKDTN